MKEIVVISGKGGTGKTSITASFGVLANRNAIITDCDVDAADMHLLMKPMILKSENFYSGLLAHVDTQKCTSCGMCADVCRFNALKQNEHSFSVIDLNCEGCGYCARICPVEAIRMVEQDVGNWYISKTKLGSTLVHAKLGIGAENSGKLVAKVKNEAKQLGTENKIDFILVDGSPGVGCPVVSSLSGAHYVVLVTEPSVAGIHDLKRVYELAKKFNLRTGCIINKSDINPAVTREIKDFLEKESIDHIASYPYNESFTKAMTNGQTIVEYDKGELREQIIESWEKVKELVKK